jgi:hypothetical protein
MFLYPVLEMVILALQALYYWFVSALCCAQCGWVGVRPECLLLCYAHAAFIEICVSVG